MHINIKWIRQVVDVVGGNAIGVDLGFLYNPQTFKNFSLGVNIQNLGSSLEYSSGISEPLPLNLKVGLSYIIGTEIEPMRVALDLNPPIDNQISVHSGVEYIIQDMFIVRVGYKTNTIFELGGLSGLCCGAGFRWENYSIDYAFVPYGDLGSTHLFYSSPNFKM